VKNIEKIAFRQKFTTNIYFRNKWCELTTQGFT